MQLSVAVGDPASIADWHSLPFDDPRNNSFSNGKEPRMGLQHLPALRQLHVHGRAQGVSTPRQRRACERSVDAPEHARILLAPERRILLHFGGDISHGAW
jgi:hypothetical protein